MPGTALSAEEREEIRVGLSKDRSYAAIARDLVRPTSTVSREVGRNGGRWHYRAADAERRARRRRRRPKTTVFEADRALAGRVEARLEALDSPMTIARREAVSHETIYQAIYAHGGRGLRDGLSLCLHHRRRRRRPRCRQVAKRLSVLGVFRPIAARPAAAEGRVEIGHFEGDLIVGAGGRSAVVTLVDRATRLCLLGALDSHHDADAVSDRLSRLLRRLPDEGLRTLTWDRGTEMAAWQRTELLTGVPVYFADPHSPWQRPVNENFNGLIRRFLPKGTDLSVHSQDDLDALSRRVNHTPRRSLGWAHAHRRYYDALVALTA